jgi:hypothetical protein
LYNTPEILQNYLASFGLCPSSGMWKFYKRPQRFGYWICLRWMGQDRPTQLGPSERASLKHWSVLPHQPEDGDTSSLRNVVVLCKTSTYQTMVRVQKKPNSSVQHTPSSESFQVYLRFCKNKCAVFIRIKCRESGENNTNSVN